MKFKSLKSFVSEDDLKISPEQFRKYLLSIGWIKFEGPTVSYIELWNFNKDEYEILIPLEETFADYIKLIATAINDLSDITKIDGKIILEEIKKQ